ncbi:MAG: penicillin acylase family protein [Spirochaetes bacterium]|jgi:penicillin amidase|nr:penicillin acylase family protein [Spirochaetota bacterium]
MPKKILFIPVKYFIPAALAVTAGISVYIYFSAFHVSYSKTHEARVENPVKIKRGTSGIPEISAKTPEDAYLALGYLHAKDRFNLMEYFRAAAGARSEKLVGEESRMIDRLSNAAGFSRKSQELVKLVHEPYLSYLTSYTEGINIYRERSGNWKISPVKWTPADVISVLLMKEWASAFLSNRELLFQIPESDRSRIIAEIIPEELQYHYRTGEEKNIEILRNLAEGVRKKIGRYCSGHAFLVPAEKTENENPFMALSLQDEISLYPAWYPVHIIIDGKKIKAITQAGLPFIYHGSSDVFTYFGFPLNLDTQEFYTLKTKKTGDAVQYQTPAGWKNFEAIRNPVYENDKTKQAIIWSTDYGIVLNDVAEDSDYRKNVVTIKFLLPGEDYISRLFDLPFAESTEAAAAMLKNTGSLPRTYLFFSDRGGYRVFCGRAIKPGKDRNVFKTAEIPPANNTVDLSAYSAAAKWPAIIGSECLDGLPADLAEQSLNPVAFERLKVIMEKDSNIGSDDIKAILGDRYSVWAERFLPLFIGILKNNPITSARLTRIYLQDWDLNMTSGDVSPTIFEMLLHKFMLETIGDNLKENANNAMASYHLLLPRFYELCRANASELFDDITTYNTETRDNVFDRAFLKTIRHYSRTISPVMENWKWGLVHKGNFKIPMIEKSLVASYFRKTEQKPFDGGVSTLYNGSMGQALEPVAETSLCCYFSRDGSSLLMNYSVSTDPGSRLYYGRFVQQDYISFDSIDEAFSTMIFPLKNK